MVIFFIFLRYSRVSRAFLCIIFNILHALGIQGLSYNECQSILSKRKRRTEVITNILALGKIGLGVLLTHFITRVAKFHVTFQEAFKFLLSKNNFTSFVR